MTVPLVRKGEDLLPRREDKARSVRDMFDKIAPRYDLVNRVMTFGLDVSWRRKTVGSLALPPGSVVGDVACGTGDLCDELRAAGYTALGFDYSAGMLSQAHTAAPLVQGDALSLPVRDGALDGITSGFALRNVSDLGAVFAEMARTVREGGRVALLEVSQPDNAILRAGHSIYFNRVVPLIGGLLSDRRAYRYLPASAAYLPPAAELKQMLHNAGFDEVAGEQLALGSAQLVTGRRAA